PACTSPTGPVLSLIPKICSQAIWYSGTSEKQKTNAITQTINARLTTEPLPLPACATAVSCSVVMAAYSWAHHRGDDKPAVDHKRDHGHHQHGTAHATAALGID